MRRSLSKKSLFFLILGHSLTFSELSFASLHYQLCEALDKKDVEEALKVIKISDQEAQRPWPLSRKRIDFSKPCYLQGLETAWGKLISDSPVSDPSLNALSVQLIKNGIDVDSPQAHYRSDTVFFFPPPTPLFISINRCNLQLAETLIGRGADLSRTFYLNQYSHSKLNYLHVASMSQCPEIVELLLKRRFDPNKANALGAPLHWLSINPSQKDMGKLKQTLKFLADRNANLNVLNAQGIPPLYSIINVNYPDENKAREAADLVVAFLENGATYDLNWNSTCLGNLLLAAVKLNSFDKVEALIAAGADVKFQDDLALRLATQLKHNFIAKFLVQNGARALHSKQNSNGEKCFPSALDSATQDSNFDLLHFFLTEGVISDIYDGGKAPLTKYEAYLKKLETLDADGVKGQFSSWPKYIDTVRAVRQTLAHYVPFPSAYRARQNIAYDLSGEVNFVDSDTDRLKSMLELSFSARKFQDQNFIYLMVTRYLNGGRMDSKNPGVRIQLPIRLKAHTFSQILESLRVLETQSNLETVDRDEKEDRKHLRHLQNVLKIGFKLGEKANPKFLQEYCNDYVQRGRSNSEGQEIITFGIAPNVDTLVKLLEVLRKRYENMAHD